MAMTLFFKLKPLFWDAPAMVAGRGRYLFNYRRIWKLSVLLTSVVALLPLMFITVVDYKVTEQALASEYRLRTARVVSNTRRAIGFFVSERRSALEFIVRDNRPEALTDPLRLLTILDGLRKSFGGGFVDLGLIDAQGKQKAYVGPYGLNNKDYRNQPWFRQVVAHGVFISDVFLGYRKVPHLVIAVKQRLPNQSFHVLRASVGIDPFEKLLADMELGGQGDAFIINRKGVLQTSSRYYGQILESLKLPMPAYHPSSEVTEEVNPQGEKVFVGYRFIEDTPFILMIVKKKYELMQPWRQTRVRLIAFLVISVSVILAVILGTVTYMVRNIHLADERRLMSLHEMEYAAKMASIGRMAASVAHEINNPLAIINEKAGLIKDLFTLKKQYTGDTKLAGLVDSILGSVLRAGKITKRLLTFARNLETSVETIRLEEVVNEVLNFLEKEAQYREIQINVSVSPKTPPIRNDRGKLQQIFLNIVNNAFAALSDRGHLDVQVEPVSSNGVEVRFCDDGCGIPPEDLQRIFEPFFSTKTGQGGTGLGLSITYNLTHEIGGDIKVTSQVGQGTCFTIRLPIAT
jgi:two-component system NtrC family sensor kinase